MTANLPPTAGEELEATRAFTLARTSYDHSKGTMTVEPATPLPTVDVLLARHKPSG